MTASAVAVTDGRTTAEFARDLASFVAIPSVSAQPRHAADVGRAAHWLAGRLRRAGLDDVRVLRTARHPIVTAAWRRAPGRPTVLVYGHYDVQPAEPVASWRTAPFVPVLRGDRLFGRGASDDKGQLLCQVRAVECLLRRHGRLPVNVVCLFEGEEEIGSPSLRGVLERWRDHFRAEVAVASDTRMLGPGRPALTYALRGSLALELVVRGPAREVHAGAYGGALHSPAQAICELVASLHDRCGRVLVPGFYGGRRPLSRAERAEMRRYGPGDAEVLRCLHPAAPWGLPGTTLYERVAAWPALTVTGVEAGHPGAGARSMIPARARATISVRPVPDQQPADVAAAIAAHIARHTPPSVRSSLTVAHAAMPVVLDRRSPAMAAAAAAYRYGFGASPVPLRSGGTIPAVSLLRRHLGLDTVLLGFALPGDNAHAPDESVHLPTLHRGTITAARFLVLLGRAHGGAGALVAAGDHSGGRSRRPW